MGASEGGPPRRVQRPVPSTRELVRRSLISGVAITIPLLVTLVVLVFVLNFLSNTLHPVVVVVQELTNQELNSLLIEGTAVLTLLLIVFVVGLLSEFGPGNGRLSDEFDQVMESIPGLGSVYTSFNEMSDLLLDSDTDSFQDVKLVEYPREGSYTVAFKTAEPPDVINGATGEDDMVTLFMPMAPNPVMGGFVIHVSRENVVDVDMTVEQGVRSIVTSGVAIGEDALQGGQGLSERKLRELGEGTYVERRMARTGTEGAINGEGGDDGGEGP